MIPVAGGGDGQEHPPSHAEPLDPAQPGAVSGKGAALVEGQSEQALDDRAAEPRASAE